MPLIKVEYEVQKPVLDLRTAMGHETVVHPEDDILNHIPVGQDYKRNICVSYHKRVGDIEAELAKCDYVVEGTYFRPSYASICNGTISKLWLYRSFRAHCYR